MINQEYMIIKNGSTWETICPFPIGYVYMSFNSTSPATTFGGTWIEIKGYFPYFNHGTGTGGSNTHTLTTAQMPSHNHSLYKRGTGGGGGWALDTQGDYTNGWDASWVSYAGEGQAHNNMPAYQTVYAWRRTA